MKVLVTAASRHGSTLMVADCLREEIEAAGCQAHFADPDSIVDLSEYDALVLGSAIYKGRWLKPAQKLARRLEAQLRDKAVWLFSSGPVGELGNPSEPPVDALAWAERLRARGHVVFAGRLDRSQLGIGERLALRGVDAQSDDDRDWLAIGRWARSIAAELRAMSSPSVAA